MQRSSMNATTAENPAGAYRFVRRLVLVALGFVAFGWAICLWLLAITGMDAFQSESFSKTAFFLALAMLVLAVVTVPAYLRECDQAIRSAEQGGCQ